MSEQQFQVGDICEFMGCRCIVRRIDEEQLYPIRVELDEDVPAEYDTKWFTLDGRYIHWHKKPSLILIERPKKKMKKVKRLVEAWVNVYTNGNQYTYGSEECADACSDLHGVERIGEAVYLCKEIEYEVEENDY